MSDKIINGVWHYNGHESEDEYYGEVWSHRDQLFYFHEKMYRERRDFPFPRRVHYNECSHDQVYFDEQVICEILFEQNEDWFSQFSSFNEWLIHTKHNILFSRVHINNAFNYFSKVTRD